MALETRPAHTSGRLAEPGPTTPSRTTARAVGILILAGWLTYGPGTGFTASILDTTDSLANVAANQLEFTLGTVLMLLNSAAVVGIGVLWYPVLKRHSERVASATSARESSRASCAPWE